MTGPLGPVYRQLIESNELTYCCMGDVFSPIEWDALEQQLLESNAGILMTSYPLQASKFSAHLMVGAKSELRQWKRGIVPQGTPVNLGIYIFSPEQDFIDFIKESTFHKEDLLFDYIVGREKENQFTRVTSIPQGININEEQDYRQFLTMN